MRRIFWVFMGGFLCLKQPGTAFANPGRDDAVPGGGWAGSAGGAAQTAASDPAERCGWFSKASSESVGCGAAARERADSPRIGGWGAATDADRVQCSARSVTTREQEAPSSRGLAGSQRRSHQGGGAHRAARTRASNSDEGWKRAECSGRRAGLHREKSHPQSHPQVIHGECPPARLSTKRGTGCGQYSIETGPCRRGCRAFGRSRRTPSLPSRAAPKPHASGG